MSFPNKRRLFISTQELNKNIEKGGIADKFLPQVMSERNVHLVYNCALLLDQMAAQYKCMRSFHLLKRLKSIKKLPPN